MIRSGITSITASIVGKKVPRNRSASFHEKTRVVVVTLGLLGFPAVGFADTDEVEVYVAVDFGLVEKLSD